MLTEINGNIDATYPIITGELTGYLGPIGTVTASTDNSVGTPHVIVTQTPTPDGLDIDFAFKEMGIPGLDLTVEQDLTEEQQQTARENIDAQEALTFDAAPTQGSQNPVTSGGVYNSVADINAKIPAAASAQNKLADKEYVDDSINRTSAFFRGNFATYADLMAVAWQTTDPDAANYVSNNDYAFVAADETHSGESWRYIYVLEEGGQDNGWAAQYRVNESPLTPEQLAALNSGITSQGVSQIETNRQGLASHVSNTSNPHQVTKAQVGLGNVDNTSDANKPVSTAQQAALDGKQDAISSTASVNSDKTPYLYRRAGGGVTIGNRAYSKLIGATIANNQLFDYDNAWTGTANDVVVSKANNKIKFVGTASANTSINLVIYDKFIDGHKYFIGGFTGGSTTTYCYRFNISGHLLPAETIVTYGTGEKKGNLTFYVFSGASVNTEFMQTVTDLTQDFGSTIADYAYTLEQGQAGAGVAWLKSYGFFGKYAPYDAGSLISTKAEKKKVVGKNVIDPSRYNASFTQNGITFTINNDGTITLNGTATANTTAGLSGYFPLTDYKFLEDTNYILSGWLSSSVYVGFGVQGAGTDYRATSSGVTMNFTADTIASKNYRIFMFVASGQTFSNTIIKPMICLSSASNPLEFAPFASQEYDLGSDELRGLFKLDNGNLYADGDIKTSDGQITRTYGIVELGAINWDYASSGNRFVSTDIASLIKHPASDSTLANIISSKFVALTLTALKNSADDNLIAIGDTGSISVRYTASGTDPAAFKTAMSGVYLVYELATPTTEQGTPYQNPQEVFADGTEEYIDTRTVPVPVGHETDYPGITYLVSKLGNETAFSPFASDVPPAPTSDGTYVLQVSVSSGTPFYRWVSAAELVGE